MEEMEGFLEDRKNRGWINEGVIVTEKVFGYLKELNLLISGVFLKVSRLNLNPPSPEDQIF